MHNQPHDYDTWADWLITRNQSPLSVLVRYQFIFSAIIRVLHRVHGPEL